MKQKKDVITIAVSRELHDELAERGRKNESFDAIIRRLIRWQ